MNGIIDWDKPDYQDRYDGRRCEDCGLPSDTRFCPACLDEARHEAAELREELC